MRHVQVIIAAPCARAPSSTALCALCTALTRRSSRTSSLWTRTVVAREAHASNLPPARGPARVDAAASRHRRRLAGRLGRGRGVRLARPRRAHLLELDRRAAHGVACSTRRWLGIAVGLVRATGDRMRFHRAQTVSRRHKHTTGRPCPFAEPSPERSLAHTCTSGLRSRNIEESPNNPKSMSSSGQQPYKISHAWQGPRARRASCAPVSCRPWHAGTSPGRALFQGCDSAWTVWLLIRPPHLLLIVGVIDDPRTKP